MRPLIEIQTIPIEIQMKTTNAHLEYARGTPRWRSPATDAAPDPQPAHSGQH